VRPKNILFKTNGFEGTVKITDFGLSKDMTSASSSAIGATSSGEDTDASFSTTTTTTTAEMGSFGFYAPEVGA
jgi:serine/threonine protein kinase